MTALLSVLILGKQLTRIQWGSQLLLAAGISLVQLHSAAGTSKHHSGSAQLMGLSALFASAFFSSFASVYFEKLLKGSTSSLWVLNIQLCFWTIPQNFMVMVFEKDSNLLVGEPLRGFTVSAWAVVVVNAFGGLLVACCIKYADNILKGFATAVAILVTSAVSVVYFGSDVSWMMYVGGGMVLTSIGLYNAPSMYAASQPDKPVSPCLLLCV